LTAEHDAVAADGWPGTASGLEPEPQKPPVHQVARSPAAVSPGVTLPAEMVEPPGLPPEPLPIQSDFPALALPDQKAKAEEPALLVALRSYLNQRPEQAAVVLERYPEPNRELLLGLLPLAVRLAEGSLRQAGPHEVAVLLEQLRSLVTPLRALAGLSIEKMCFCKQIKNYGVYEPLPEDHPFRPGEYIQLYAELRNFSSEWCEPFYVTRLTSEVEIRDYEGHTVLRQGFKDQERPDRSQTLRHDYFNNYHFCIPASIPPGRYTLWLHVTDVPTKRTAKRSLDLRITSLPTKGL
jgi:hypothetical protein